jgi:beta-mannosidase
VTPERITELHYGWQLAEVPHQADWNQIQAIALTQWLPAVVPGSAHSSLLAAGRLADPFYGMQEEQARWVAERSWAWRLRFDAPTLEAHEDLVFEGLDSYCEVWLNGEALLSSENMFVPRRVDVRSRLRARGNELLLRFDPALDRARAQEARHGRGQLWNGDSARLHARKAQYHFGWDWGPELITCGPWQPVKRHGWSARVADVELRPQVDPAGPRATLAVTPTLAGDCGQLQLSLALRDPQGQLVGEWRGAATSDTRVIEVAEAQLWWPRGLGGQPLYTLSTRLLDGDRLLSQDERRIGLRRLRLRQEPVRGEAGSSFHFEINGEECFIGGANWIPDDSLLERIRPERYRERVQQAADANMSMLRVWGGGIYEAQAFYDACDELGLLVWQDFMFACGIYPAHADFQASVREEASTAVRRLRHHACLALWCGNNEDYLLAESVGLYGPNAPSDRFEARAIYERLLPEVCAELDPDRPYWPGSPYSPDPSGATSANSALGGDRHSWEVWHQQMLPYQRYGEVQARFVSEFGLQSHPSLPLLESILPVEERFPESRTLMWHNKAGSGTPDGHRRLAVYLADNLRVGPSLAEHVYATQFVQAEAMRVAYQDFRRRWQQPGARACGGALVWQLNDCWPVTSWALIDSAGRVKPAWHTVRRALAPVAVAARLPATAGQAATLAVMNGSLAARSLILFWRVFNRAGACLGETRLSVDVPGSASIELQAPVPVANEPLMGELLACDPGSDQLLARDCAWTEPFKFYDLSAAGIDLRRVGRSLQLRADVPVKGLWLEAPGVSFSDNFIDLAPGRVHDVVLGGGMPSQLRITALDHPGRVLPLD